MIAQRWLRIIPVALIMYTISYVDRTNISLALDPKISSMLRDLRMDDQMKGQAAGIFFLGYVLLQMAGGWLAGRWSAKKLVSVCLVFWGACAVGCGLARSFHQFEFARFLLGAAESSVFPATVVLLAHWFPRAERARANAGWLLCQPLAVAGSAPLTGWLLGVYGWKTMTVLEGILPFLWLPLWWFFIRDHPAQAKWISADERDFLETTLKKEAAQVEPTVAIPTWKKFCHPALLVMIPFYFLHNCAAYGCMTFFTDTLNGRHYSALQHSLLFAVPYVVTVAFMVLNSWHSDKTQERRFHTAAMYAMSGISLILSVSLRDHFWVSFGFLCLAIPGPFAGMAPFWAIVGETLPAVVLGAVMGLVNACGNLGGFAGPRLVGALGHEAGFNLLGVGMIVCAGLAFLLPKPKTFKQ